MTLRFGFSLLLFALLASCATAPVTREYMIISPKMITFDHRGDTTKSVSITHSCTCPFEWSSAFSTDTASHWITFTHDTVGDHSSIPIIVHPWMLPKDTNDAWIAINSAHGSYGTDTIHVTAYR
jgi:hypothetical protein